MAAGGSQGCKRGLGGCSDSGGLLTPCNRGLGGCERAAVVDDTQLSCMAGLCTSPSLPPGGASIST